MALELTRVAAGNSSTRMTTPLTFTMAWKTPNAAMPRMAAAGAPVASRSIIGSDTITSPKQPVTTDGRLPMRSDSRPAHGHSSA
jgi:hypothetical protein